jgi:hypothetical protein
MKKQIRQRTMNAERTRQRRLELARETVRTLGAGELAQAVGGSACETTSYTTDKKQTSHR